MVYHGISDIVYLPKIHRAPRASSFRYLDWKHISAWDVKIVSAVDLKCGPVGIFTSPCGHGSDHVVLRLAGVACSSNMSPKGSSHNPKESMNQALLLLSSRIGFILSCFAEFSQHHAPKNLNKTSQISLKYVCMTYLLQMLVC